MKERSVFLILIFLCLANFYAYAQSIIIVHKTSAEAENDLELIGYHINHVNDNILFDNRRKLNPRAGDSFYEGYFQEYVVRNNGGVPYKAEFGVWNQYPSEIPSELFVINGVNVRHQFAHVNELDAFENELSYLTIGYFAFIEVVFPPKEETRIRVNDFPSHISYNSFISKSSPRFTVTIGNWFIDRSRPYFEIEEYWINDISVNRRSESLVSMLEQKGSLSNDLFAIRKTDGNTWEIEFTGKFVDAYRPNLTIDIEYGPWGYYTGFDFNSAERITPYRYIFLTNRQLQVIRNAYYARHGYIFRNPALGRMYVKDDMYFESSFGNINYRENPNFTEAMLTETDHANIAIIQRLEALAGD
jgi:hypothetical protein